jgi:hypothetical protein
MCCEVTAKRHDEFAEQLADAGYPHQADQLDALTPSDPYFQMIASRVPITSGDQIGPRLNPNRFIHASIAVPGGQLELLGIHVPVSDPDASDFFESTCTVVDELRGRRCVLVGDVNADARYPGLVTRFLPRILSSSWVDALTHCDPDGDHDSYWGRSTAFAIDRAWVTPTLLPALSACSVIVDAGGIPTCGPTHRVSHGALSDHRPEL